MKTIKLFFRLSLFLLMIASCKKEQQTPATSTNSSGIVVVTEGAPVVDIDNNVYKTVRIGSQVWMLQNLRVRHYRNGDSIPKVKDDAKWNSMRKGAFCNFNNEPDNVCPYGRLYNWYAVADPRGIGPKGWHVPTIDEWKILVDYLGGVNVAGGHLKEAGFAHWAYPNAAADNSSGFTALPGGYRYPWGAFWNLGYVGPLWTSSENGTGNPWQVGIYYHIQGVNLNDEEDKREGLCVRLIKD